MSNIYNVGNDIVNAYLTGLQYRLLKERLERERELMALRQAQLEETIRANKENESIRREEILRKAEEDKRQLAQARARAAAEYGKLLATGQLQFPQRQPTPAEIAEAVAFNRPFPDLRMPYKVPGFEDLEIKPTDVFQDPFEYQRKLSQARAAGKVEVELPAKLKLEELEFENKLKLLEEQFKNQRDLLQMRLEAQKSRMAETAERFWAGMDQRQRSGVANVVERQLKSKVLSDYFGAARAMHYLNTNAIDPQSKEFTLNSLKTFKFIDPNNGVRDLSLIYNYIRSLDESVVREGEIRNLERAIPYLNKFGITLQRLTNVTGNAPLLTEAQRKAIAAEIIKNYRAKLAAAVGHLRSTYKIAKLHKPDLTESEFLSVVYPFVSNSADFNGVFLNNVALDTENTTAPNRRPVTLVPKK